MTQPISTATRVASINRRASREQRDGLGRSAVVLQQSEHGVDVIPVAAVAEVAGAVAAQVVTLRRHGAVAVRSCHDY